MKELFGQRLREQRIKHGLTLEQLAEKSELSSNYIGAIERGLKEPTSPTSILQRKKCFCIDENIASWHCVP